MVIVVVVLLSMLAGAACGRCTRPLPLKRRRVEVADEAGQSVKQIARAWNAAAWRLSRRAVGGSACPEMPGASRLAASEIEQNFHHPIQRCFARWCRAMSPLAVGAPDRWLELPPVQGCAGPERRPQARHGRAG